MSGFWCYTRDRKERNPNEIRMEKKKQKIFIKWKLGPSILQVPGQSYIVIDGKDPNQEDFSEHVGPYMP